MRSPFQTRKPKAGKAIFAFHPTAVNDPNLRNALETSEFVATAIHAPLMAVTLIESLYSDFALEIHDRRGDSIETGLVSCENGTKRNGVEQFLEDKNLKSAKLIIEVTHLPKSLRAKVFDHFGARLIESSSIPILAVRYDAPPMTKIARIVFISDLADSERSVFTEALSWAKTLGAEVLLTSSLIGPWSIEAQSLDAMTPVILESDDEINQQTDEANRIGQRWCREATESGVMAEFKLTSSYQKIADSSIEIANQYSADMIVIGRTHYQSLASTILFGGPLHDLIDLSRLPILILMNSPANVSQQH